MGENKGGDSEWRVSRGRAKVERGIKDVEGGGS